MLSKVFYLFMHPTGPEIAFAVIVGLSIGFGIGYFIDVNGISSWKEFREFIKREFKK